MTRRRKISYTQCYQWSALGTSQLLIGWKVFIFLSPVPQSPVAVRSTDAYNSVGIIAGQTFCLLPPWGQRSQSDVTWPLCSRLRGQVQPVGTGLIAPLFQGHSEASEQVIIIISLTDSNPITIIVRSKSCPLLTKKWSVMRLCALLLRLLNFMATSYADGFQRISCYPFPSKVLRW